MITPKQKELLNLLLEMTKSNKAIWAKHITPKSFIFKVKEVRYIVKSYRTSVDNKIFDCISLNIISDNDKLSESCIGCNDTDYINDFTELRGLYDAVIKQYMQRDDKEIGGLIDALKDSSI